MIIVETLQRTFMEGYASMDIQVMDILFCMVVSVALSLYIYLVYSKVNKNSFYNKNFNLSLVALSIVTAAIILTIQSSIVVSLGTVGALSIVRFRTAIKDPLDLVFLFWAISVGIITGAGFAVVAVIASVVVTIVVMAFAAAPEARVPLILVVNSTSIEDEKAILEVVKKYCKSYKVKARNFTKNHLDMAIEVQAKEQGALAKELTLLPNVTSASLVSHDGEVTL